MQAITPQDLTGWLESEQDQAEDPQDRSYAAYLVDQEHQYTASLTAAEWFAYLVHIGELAEICPRCGSRYVEVTFWQHPDMVGEVVGSTLECCGYTDSYSTGLEYRDGVAVDVR